MPKKASSENCLVSSSTNDSSASQLSSTASFLVHLTVPIGVMVMGPECADVAAMERKRTRCAQTRRSIGRGGRARRVLYLLAGACHNCQLPQQKTAVNPNARAAELAHQ